MTVTDPGTTGPAQASPSPDADISALLGELGQELALLVRQEVELAKAEIRQATHHAAGVGAGFGAAALVGHLALAILAVAAGLGLAEVVPAGVAFLVVGLVLLAIAGVALLVGRRNLDALDPVPRKTIDSIKEDVSWLRARIG